MIGKSHLSYLLLHSTFTFIRLAHAFIQSNIQMIWNTIREGLLKRTTFTAGILHYQE